MPAGAGHANRARVPTLTSVPHLIAVSGRPGAGRTLTARLLAVRSRGVAVDIHPLAAAFADDTSAPHYTPGVRAHRALIGVALDMLATTNTVIVDAPFAPDVFTSDDWSHTADLADAANIELTRLHLLCRPDVAHRRLAARTDAAGTALLEDYDTHSRYWDRVDLACPVDLAADNSEGLTDLSLLLLATRPHLAR